MYIKLVEIPEGCRGLIFVLKNWKFRGGGGNSLHGESMDTFWNYTFVFFVV